MPKNQESVSLSPQTLEIVEGLRKTGRFGGKSTSAVLRYLIEEAIKQLIRDDFIEKELRTMERLRNLD